MNEVEILLEEEKIKQRIAELAEELSRDYEGREVLMIGILNGAVYFLTELTQKMSVPVEIDFMAASSYGSGTVSSGNVVITRDLERSIENKHVIIIEDIIDTGHTLSILVEMLKEQSPASIKTCVLLDKPSRRTVELQADYVGFEIPDAFIVGWGLDYDQKYRNLPYIGVIKNS